MTELNLKSNHQNPVWFTPEDLSNPSGDAIRWRTLKSPLSWRPPTDVYETESALMIRVELAGMREADFSIGYSERLLTIRGARQDTQERRAYHQMEIPFGEFFIEIELTVAIAADQIAATYQDGFLRIVLPKAQPVQIKIKQ
jgi:HSP20 family protein